MTRWELVIPKDTVNDDHVEITEILHAPGTHVAAGEAVLEYETSKAVTVLEAPIAGRVHYLCTVGQALPVGAVAAVVEDTPSVRQPTEQPAGGDSPASGLPSADSGPVFSESGSASANPGPVFSDSGSARLAELRLDHARFAGMDFVTAADVDRAAGLGSNVSPATNSSAEPALDARRVPLSATQRAANRALEAVAGRGLPCAVSIKVPAAGVMRGLARRSRMPSLLPVTVLETSRLLAKYPELNAYLDADHIVYHAGIHIGVAMDREHGLKVVRLAHADHLGIAAIEARLVELADAYEQGTLGVADLTGTTFTVSDLSSEGVHSFTPLVNADQSAILGVAAPEADTGMAILTLAFDHRVTTGLTAARFLRELRDRLASYAVAEPSATPAQSAPPPAVQPEAVRCARCYVSLEADRDAGGFGLVAVLCHDGSQGYICRFCITEG